MCVLGFDISYIYNNDDFEIPYSDCLCFMSASTSDWLKTGKFEAKYSRREEIFNDF